MLTLFVYLTLYYFLMNLYIFCGLKDWDKNESIHKREIKSNNKIEYLKANMRQYYIEHEDCYKKKSKIVKIIFGVPSYVGLIIYSFVNYCRQTQNTMKLLALQKICEFNNASKQYLDNGNFIRFKKRTKQLCIMIALCFIFFWMNFSVGENSSLTKIVSGFATMIIIPIAINRYTS